MSIRGSFSLLLLINSLEYDWSLLIFTYSLVSISAICLLSVYLMLFAISVLVRVKGLPLNFLIVFQIVLLSVLWFNVDIKSFHFSSLVDQLDLLFRILVF